MSNPVEELRALVGPHGTDGALQARDVALGNALIQQIVEQKLVDGAPLLAALAADPTPYSQNKANAVAALRELGPAAADAIVHELLRAIEEQRVPWDPHHYTLFVGPMIDALLAADDRDPFERLAPFFDPQRVAVPTGARIVNDVVVRLIGRMSESAHAVVKLLHPDRTPAVAIGQDPRWLDRLVRLLGDRRTRPLARHALKSARPADVKAAYERVAGAKTKPLPPNQPDAAEVALAEERAATFMRDVRAALERAAETLRAAKYSPRAKGKCLGVVDRTIASGQLAELEKLTKTRLPELVRALYLVVGPIDFQRPLDKEPPPGTAAFAAAPRFQIAPLDRAIKDLKARIRDNTGIPPALRDPLALDLSEEAAVRVDAWSFDPAMETGNETLSEYLRRRVSSWALEGVAIR